MKGFVAAAMALGLGILAAIAFFGEVGFLDVFWHFQVAPFAPLSLVVLGVCGFAGLCAGGVCQGRQKRLVAALSVELDDLETGNYEYQGNFPELERPFEKVAVKMKSQVQTIQKLTNERADKMEELLEKALRDERNRLARDLHDSVSQQLFAISMMMSAVNEGAPPDMPLKKQLGQVETMAVQAQGEMRALLLHLRPAQLEGKRLDEGIQELLTELSLKQSLEISWRLDEVHLPKGVEDHLFRILQEALSNTLRHGKAQRLEVRLRLIESFAILRIIDDGVGFDPATRKAGSYGLGSMEERALEIGGTMKIVSLPGKGTQIEVKVPVERSMGHD